jgi:hypothetical protein
VNQQRIENLRELLITIDDLLACRFLSLVTRQQLELFKIELEVDLRFALDQKKELQLAG